MRWHAYMLTLAASVALPISTLVAQSPAPSASTPAQAPASGQAADSVTGYICPMHPDVIETEPGKCSRCGMELVPGNPLGTANYRLRIETIPAVIKPGEKVTFRFHIEDPVNRRKVTEFANVHDKKYHLFILSRDTEVFMHEHPVVDAEGVYSLDVTLPKAGHYVLISDFFPVGGSGQALLTPIVTAGFDGDVMSQIPTLTPDTSWTKREDGTDVDLRMAQSALVASEDLDLPLHFVDATTGDPVHDLERYLGAFGHALIVNEQLTEYIHAHPEETLEGTGIQSGGGPDVVFHTLFPKAGRYKAWIQFQRGGKLSTVSFTFRVLRPGENLTGMQ
ncbi:MAG: heavy metal-binding domain-containing protein [Vicinamibacterales bacterium]